MSKLGNFFKALGQDTVAGFRASAGRGFTTGDYDAVGFGRRGAAWQPTHASQNAIMFRSGKELLAKARDMVRRNPWARRGIDSYVSNAIGIGIRPQPKGTDEEFRRQAMELWDQFVGEADADGINDFYGLQTLVATAILEGGECFVRFRTRRIEDGLAVPFQLQLLEAEMLPLEMNTVYTNGNPVKSGIEFDLRGRRVAYHFLRNHPGDNLLTFKALSNTATVRVPAEQVLHIYKPRRPGQIRGESWLAPVISRLKEMDDYDDAELVRKKTAAMFVAFIKKTDLDQNVVNEVSSEDEGVGDAILEPGTTQYLLPGEEVEIANPAESGGSYEPFTRRQLQGIAAGLGNSYENMTGDLKGVSFSSIRSTLLELRRALQSFQMNVMTHQFNKPVYRRFVLDAVMMGKLDAPTIVSEERRFTDAKWIAHGWNWVDPAKEVKAMTESVRGGLLSRSEALRQTGHDPEQMDQEISEDNARTDRLGIVVDTDARRTTKTGQTAGQTLEGSDIEGDEDGGEDEPGEEERAEAIAEAMLEGGVADEQVAG